MDGQAKYGRVLLKLSGESLAGGQGYGFSGDSLAHYGREVAYAVRTLGVEVAIVLGGGEYIPRFAGGYTGL